MGWFYFGFLVFFFRFMDSIKYRFMTKKISRLKSSREISKKFLLLSIGDKIFLSIWAWFRYGDWVVALSALVALFTSIEALYYTYLHYPYCKRGLKNFKRPPFLRFVWNSLLPNKYAKRY